MNKRKMLWLIPLGVVMIPIAIITHIRKGSPYKNIIDLIIGYFKDYPD